MEKNKRIVWVDYAKVLCIFFVTLVHTPIYRPVYDVLCAFIIPMFFSCRGISSLMTGILTIGFLLKDESGSCWFHIFHWQL